MGSEGMLRKQFGEAQIALILKETEGEVIKLPQ